MDQLSTTKGISELAVELHKAQQRLDEANHAYEEASASQTTALNKLNRIQKEIDNWVVKQRADADLRSDWHKNR